MHLETWFFRFVIFIWSKAAQKQRDEEKEIEFAGSAIVSVPWIILAATASVVPARFDEFISDTPPDVLPSELLIDPEAQCSVVSMIKQPLAVFLQRARTRTA